MTLPLNLSAITIQKLLQGDRRALLFFYKKISPFLQSYYKTRVSDPQDRDELVQDTLLSILDSLPQFKHGSAFSTWCFSIVRHELIDYYRRKKIKHLLFSHFPFLKNVVDKALGPQLKLEEKELKHKIFTTFSEISEGYAEVLRLRYIEGLSVSAIAQKLDITYKAAESRLSRARLAFQQEFVSV
ncbi:MAG: RNA polymerase sigma factor [Patescibacteria group bacterium]|jgi:RNA polymerase sigma-70 factor (ECF subfamily)